jgi:hypothetical protein
MRVKSLLLTLVVLSLLAIFSTTTFASPAKPPQSNAATVAPRVTQPIDESRVVSLVHNTRPEATPANDRGAVPEGFNAEHMLLLLQRSPQQEKELDTLIDQMHDKNSPNFHQWLTPEEFGARFGVAQEDIDKVTGWLESHGFRINQVYPNHILIDFSGTAGQIQEAFHTSIHNIEVKRKSSIRDVQVKTEAHVANMSDPQIPAALAPVIKGIASLNDFKPEAYHKSVRHDFNVGGCASSSEPTFGGTCYFITPQDDAAIYNTNPLWTAGITGAGQTIAVLEDTDTYNGTSDWSTYMTTFGLSGYGGTYTQVHPSCSDPGTNEDDSEAAIDVEMASTSAPGAAIENLACASGTFTFGGQIALQNLINGSGPYPIISQSYGEPESVAGWGFNAVFNSTFQQAAAEGVSVFVSSGDNGPSGFTEYSDIQIDTLGITGWGETQYNVSVGGTDFEEVYNSKKGGPALTTYWNGSNSSTYGSAKGYIPEMPWDNSCANAQIAEIINGSTDGFIGYGANGACNKTTSNTFYEDTGASAGGASNCATNTGGTAEAQDFATATDCQGYPKPSWQSAYGVPADGARDIPDVVAFAANGDWGHGQVVCWSDPSYTSDGSASCSGTPDTWSVFGGTSVATPYWAGIQALVNQHANASNGYPNCPGCWGNPATYYYQIAQGEYGTQGGSYLGSACNSSAVGGPSGSCVFYDITEGDIVENCLTQSGDYIARSDCYGAASGDIFSGATSTDNITAITIINGGKGYNTTTLPTCSIAAPTALAAYKKPTYPTGAPGNIYGGGTQATCSITSAQVNTGSTTAVWAIKFNEPPGGTTTGFPAWGNGQVSVNVAGTSYTFVTALSGSTPNEVLLPATSLSASSQETDVAKNLEAAINNTSSQCFASPCFLNVSAANSVVTATETTNTTTVTSRTAGYAGNFSVNWGPGDALTEEFAITQTTAGQGPGYVSGITIGTAGVGYGPNAAMTISGGPSGATGAVAVANTSFTTIPTAFGPAYGAANGYDLASGLGSVNACNLVYSSVWGSSTQTTTTAVTSSLNPSAYGQAISFTATVTSGCGGAASGGTVQFTIDGVNYGSPVSLSGGSANTGTIAPALADGTHTVTAAYSGATGFASSASGTLNQVVGQASAATVITSSGSPSAYGSSVTFTATINGQYNNVKGRVKNNTVTGTVAWSANTGCGTTAVTAGNPGTATCTTSSLLGGTDSVTGTYSGDSNHTGSTGSFNQTVSTASTTIDVTSVSPASEDYGSTAAVTITAVLSWSGSGVAPTAANVTIGGNSTGTYGATSCAAPSGTTISCSATLTPSGTDPEGNYNETASFTGDSNYGASSSPETNNFAVNGATSSMSVACSPSPASYGQSVTCTATINGENGNVRRKVKQHVVTGTVAWSANTGCGTTSVTAGNTGTATCTTSSLGLGSDTITATYSGDGNHSGSSANTSEVVQGGVATSISVTSVSPSNEDYGADSPVTITAQLSWTGGGAAPTAANVSIGGNGNGTYGATSCAAPSGDTMNCSATYTPSNADGVGSYTETASFSGDSAYNASSSSQTNNFAINIATSSTSVASSQNPSTYASPVTFTATIDGENGAVRGRAQKNGVKQHAITGSVAWSANTGCGTTPVTAGYPGTATCTTSRASSLGVGTDSVTATYSGDSNHTGSAGSVNQVVQGGIATTIDVTNVSPASEDYASTAPVTITAVLSWTGNGKAPTAADVTIGGNGTGTYGATSCAARVHETITCTATFTPAGTDLPGAYTETASFSGDTNYSSSTSPETNNFTVNEASSTTAVTSSPNPSAYATSVTFTATITGEFNAIRGGVRKNVVKQHAVTGSVAWSSNTGCGTTSVTTNADGSGTATCTTSRASHLPVGTDAVTATYSGDSNHTGSTGSVNQVVQGGLATTIDVTNVSPASEDYGSTAPITITAVLSWTGHGVAPTAADVTIGGNGTGTYGATSCAARVHETITCTATFTPAGTDAAGNYTETATFSGDANYSTSSSPETNNFTVNAATSSTAVSSSGPSTYGQPATFTATITGENGAVRGKVKRVVSGTVTWSDNTGCGTTAVTSGYPGTATCTTSSLAGGNDAISATYSGDSSHSGSSGTLSGGQTVNPASQTVSFTTNPPANAQYNSTFTVAGSATSGLSVSYGSSGACENSGALYTMTSGTGTCTVTISQAGNNDYSAATPVSKSVNATLASQTITVVTPAPAAATLSSHFTVVATAPSGNVTYGSSGGCTNNAAGTYTMASSGHVACNETISAAATSNYSAAPNVNETTTVAAAIAPTVTFTGAPTTANYQSTFNVATTTNAGVSATITAAGSCSISGNTVTMTSGTGMCTMTASWPATDVYKAATATQHTSAEKIAPTVTFTGAPASAAYLSTFTPSTTTNSGVTPTITSTTATICSVSSGVVTMKSGTGTCTVKASWAANSDYLAASLEQSTNATLLATTTTITGTATGTKPLYIIVSFTVSNGTSTAALGNVTVTAAPGAETCTASVATGKCELKFLSTDATSQSLSATYVGNTNNATSTSASFGITIP